MLQQRPYGRLADLASTCLSTFGANTSRKRLVDSCVLAHSGIIVSSSQCCVGLALAFETQKNKSLFFYLHLWHANIVMRDLKHMIHDYDVETYPEGKRSSFRRTHLFGS